MNVNRVVRMIAGLFILISLALGAEQSPVFQNEKWLWFTVFVGANLFQSSFTNFCPLDKILVKLGIQQ